HIDQEVKRCLWTLRIERRNRVQQIRVNLLQTLIAKGCAVVRLELVVDIAQLGVRLVLVSSQLRCSEPAAQGLNAVICTAVKALRSTGLPRGADAAAPIFFWRSSFPPPT